MRGTASNRSHYKRAGIYSYLGETEKAIEYLKILEELPVKSPLVYFLQFDPLFDNLRENSEFQKIINP